MTCYAKAHAGKAYFEPMGLFVQFNIRLQYNLECVRLYIYYVICNVGLVFMLMPSSQCTKYFARPTIAYSLLI